MKKLVCVVALLGVTALFTGAVFAAEENAPFYYLSPVPGSKYVSENTTIIFRPNAAFKNQRPDWTSSVRVEGSDSGVHAGGWIFARDSKTVIFRPHQRFDQGEVVTVFVDGTAGDPNGQGGFSFSFQVSPVSSDVLMEEVQPLCECLGFEPDALAPDFADRSAAPPLQRVVNDVNCTYELPSDFPGITVATCGHTAPGYIFLGNARMAPGPAATYMMILNNNGFPVFFQKTNGWTLDFKKQPDGRLSYVRYGSKYYLMDNTYTVVDSFWAQNYSTDVHELQITPSGNALLIGNETLIIDMSQIVEGGNPAARVTASVIQEIDPDKNVVFQWRGFDHFEILDATHVYFKARMIDFVHTNAVELDDDGNILISSRSLDEITKINRDTGEIIWRMGGNNNEFTLVNDTQWFSKQHSVRRLDKGNITVFDNGNFNDPRESRAVEYEVDEVAKTATLVWEYRHDPPIYSSAMSNVQRLSNGNTVVGWGAANPTVTEVRRDGSKVFELAFDPGTISYRAFRFEWEGVAAAPYLWVNSESQTHFTLHFTKFGDRHVKSYNVYRGDWPEPSQFAGNTTSSAFEVTDIPVGTTVCFRVTALDWNGVESPYSNVVPITPDYIDLSLDKAVDPSHAAVGDTVTFAVTVYNDGTMAGTGVTVQDGLPAGYAYAGDDGGGSYDPASGIWTLGELAAVDTLSLGIDAVVLASGAPGAYVNTAQIASANEIDLDSEPGNDDPGEDDVASAGITGALLAPEIRAVRDVPGDQGGLVWLSWYASALDLVKDDYLSHYTIWRAIRPEEARRLIALGAVLVEDAGELKTGSKAGPVVRRAANGGKIYFWELVDSQDAYYLEAYAKTVATLFDSTAVCDEYHYFQVIAHSTDPKIFWVSNPDSGRSVDNLAPGAPAQLTGSYDAASKTLILSWRANNEPDFSRYKVYRGTDGDFTPSGITLVTSTLDTLATVGPYGPTGRSYVKVSALDENGNESVYACLSPEDVQGLEINRQPMVFALGQNRPNPFNPATNVPFTIEKDGVVTLQIYDVAGRLVRTLVDRPMKAGRYTEAWDGRDERGQKAATGLYFFRLQSGGKTSIRKGILLK